MKGINNKDIPQKIQNASSYITYKKELQNLMSEDNWEYEETIQQDTLARVYKL